METLSIIAIVLVLVATKLRGKKRKQPRRSAARTDARKVKERLAGAARIIDGDSLAVEDVSSSGSKGSTLRSTDRSAWIRAGQALTYMKFSRRYEAEEREAKRRRAGMRSGTWITPWAWSLGHWIEGTAKARYRGS